MKAGDKIYYYSTKYGVVKSSINSISKDRKYANLATGDRILLKRLRLDKGSTARGKKNKPKKVLGSRAIYNRFFEKFKRRSGYLGSLLKNQAGNPVFEFSFDYVKDAREAFDFLKEYKNFLTVRKSSINDKKGFIIFKK